MFAWMNEEALKCTLAQARLRIGAAAAVNYGIKVQLVVRSKR